MKTKVRVAIRMSHLTKIAKRLPPPLSSKPKTNRIPSKKMRCKFMRSAMMKMATRLARKRWLRITEMMAVNFSKIKRTRKSWKEGGKRATTSCSSTWSRRRPRKSWHKCSKKWRQSARNSANGSCSWQKNTNKINPLSKFRTTDYHHKKLEKHKNYIILTSPSTSQT